MCPGTCYLPPKPGEHSPQYMWAEPPAVPSQSPHPSRLTSSHQCLHKTDPNTSAKAGSVCGPEYRIHEHHWGSNLHRTSVWGDPSFESRLFWMPGIFGEQNLYLNVKQEVTHLLVGLYED